MSEAHPAAASKSLLHLRIGPVISVDDVTFKCDRCGKTDTLLLDKDMERDCNRRYLLESPYKRCAWVTGFFCTNCNYSYECAFDQPVMAPCKACLHTWVTDEPLRGVHLYFERTSPKCRGHWFHDDFSDCICQSCSVVECAYGGNLHCCCPQIEPSMDKSVSSGDVYLS